MQMLYTQTDCGEWQREDFEWLKNIPETQKTHHLS